MPVHPSKILGAALCGAALFFGSVELAAAATLPVTSLLPALDVFVDSVVAGHAAAATCAGPKSPARDEADWQKAKAIFIATLWANDFPINYVRTASQRLDKPTAGAKPNCSAPALAGQLGPADREGWVAALREPLDGIGLAIVEHPVAPAVWNQIKADFATEMPLQQRLFECVAVTAPAALPPSVNDWDEMLAGIGRKLVAAGLPRDDVSAQLSAADANSLWHRVAPDAEAGLRDACASEKAWQARLYQLQWGRLAGMVDKLLANPVGGK